MKKEIEKEKHKKINGKKYNPYFIQQIGKIIE